MNHHRYLLCPGSVISRTDGDRHHITAVQLARLYGVSMDDCIVLSSDWSGPSGERRRNELRARADSGDLIALHPRYDGNYSLPEPV